MNLDLCFGFAFVIVFLNQENRGNFYLLIPPKLQEESQTIFPERFLNTGRRSSGLGNRSCLCLCLIVNVFGSIN